MFNVTDIVLCYMLVPERRSWVEQQAQALQLQHPGLEVVFACDEQHTKKPWHTAKRAWQLGLETQRSICILLQDDLIVCRDLVPAVAQFMPYLPQQLISLYIGATGATALQRAAAKNQHWLRGGSLGGTSICLERARVLDLMQWSDENIDPVYPHDDRVYCVWLEALNQPPWFTSPSLVQHGHFLSRMGHPNRKAQSPYFIEDSLSALEIDWTLGLEDPVRNSYRLPASTRTMFKYNNRGV